MPTNEYNLSPENVAAIVAEGRAIQVIESLQEAIKKLEADAIEYQYDGPIKQMIYEELIPIERLSQDLAKASRELGRADAFLALAAEFGVESVAAFPETKIARGSHAQKSHSEKGKY